MLSQIELKLTKDRKDTANWTRGEVEFLEPWTCWLPDGCTFWVGRSLALLFLLYPIPKMGRMLSPSLTDWDQPVTPWQSIIFATSSNHLPTSLQMHFPPLTIWCWKLVSRCDQDFRYWSLGKQHGRHLFANHLWISGNSHSHTDVSVQATLCPPQKQMIGFTLQSIAWRLLKAFIRYCNKSHILWHLYITSLQSFQVNIGSLWVTHTAWVKYSSLRKDLV